MRQAIGLVCVLSNVDFISQIEGHMSSNTSSSAETCLHNLPFLKMVGQKCRHNSCFPMPILIIFFQIIYGNSQVSAELLVLLLIWHID